MTHTTPADLPPAAAFAAAVKHLRATGTERDQLLALLLERIIADAFPCRCTPETCSTQAALAVARQVLGTTEAEPPLSPYYSHEACGFHWHGRDGMDIPMRDGQPVCPRCELRRLAAEAQQPACTCFVINDGGVHAATCATRAAEAQQPTPAVAEETKPEGQPLHSDDVCPGFPERCPSIRTVPADPPTHYGGIRCGCADTPAPAEETTP